MASCSSPSFEDFFHYLYARCGDFPQAQFTLTAIHPDGKHPTPSRHLLLSDTGALADALTRLLEANRRGWGAFFGVGLRRPGLSRYRRGGSADIVALPALFVDVDDDSAEKRELLAQAIPPPSCLIASGGGFHAYWWLDTPLEDMALAHGFLRRLAQHFGGDPMSPAQSLRIPHSINNKPDRDGKRCHIITLTSQRHTLADFRLPYPLLQGSPSRNAALNPQLIAAVATVFITRGYRLNGDWLTGRCPYPQHHRHGDRKPSFGFNIRSGYGSCFRCGSFLLRDLCAVFGISPAHYGGLYARS